MVGSPGIGKSYWARRLAHHLSVPTTKIDATGEPATFALVGSQRGWSSAHPGKVMKTILQERHGGPLVILDEVEKARETYSTRGSRHTLTDALLPLLERMTAASWECPFFQIKFDMSWINWVMTANSRQGLPEPLQSRCIVLDLPDLTLEQLRGFACSEGRRRGLPEPALAAVLDIFEGDAVANARLSLRMVSRMLDRAEMLAQLPMLN
nr:AAA family ATPase [Jannaschia sp. S6380]